MSSSNFVGSPVQSQKSSVRLVAILLVVGLIAAVVLAIPYPQNVTTGSSVGVVDSRLSLPTGSSWHISPSIDSRLSIPTGSSWHTSPSIDSRLNIPTGSSWHTSPSIDSRLVIPTGSSWHQSPTAAATLEHSRLTNPHGTSWFQSVTAGEAADASGN